MTSIRVDQIADRLHGELKGDGNALITGVAGIRYAGPSELTYVGQTRYAADAATTRAGAIIVGRDWNFPGSTPVICIEDPEKAFVEVASWFAPPPVSYLPGIHPSAVISPDAVLGKDVHIGPYCVIGRDVSIGDRTVLVGHNVLADGVSLGSDGLLYPLVSIREHVRVGDRVILHNGVVIGSDGFGYDVDKKGVRTKVPQNGIVEIGNDVEVGANSTIDRARFGKTSIGNGVKIDNLVMVGHNVTIGDHAVLVAQVGIAGSTSIGPHAILAGQAGVAGHLEIGAGAVIGAQSGVTKNIPPRTFTLGFPARPQKEFSATQAHINRLPELKQRVADLETRIKALEES